MANKPSILEAQTLPFSSLFKSCMINTSQMYGKAVGILLAIIAVCYLLIAFGGGVWDRIASAFWSVMEFLNLANIIAAFFALVGASVVSAWTAAVAFADGAYTFTQKLLPGVLEFTAITCRDVTNKVGDKDVVTSVCDGTVLMHFPASGVYMAIVIAEWLLLLTAILWIGARINGWLNETWEWRRDKWKDFLSFMAVGIPALMLTIFLGYILTGVTHMLAMPIFKQAFHASTEYEKAFSVSFALMLLIFFLPAVWLQDRMYKQVSKAVTEAKDANRQLDVLDWSELQEATSTLLTEPIKMPIYRTIAVVLGAVAFLALMQLGVSLVPSGIGFGITFIVAMGLVGITLACVITCYPSLKEGYKKLEEERAKAVAAYKEKYND